MFYVLFTNTNAPGQAESGERYYRTLQPLLQKNEGFIEETPFGHPTDPERSLEFARFENEESLVRWSNHPTHLRIMHQGRHKIFKKFRVTVGSDTPSAMADRDGRVVVMYTRPAGPSDPEAEVMKLSHVAGEEAGEKVAEESFWIGETSWMWVTRLKAGEDVADFEELLKR